MKGLEYLRILNNLEKTTVFFLSLIIITSLMSVQIVYASEATYDVGSGNNMLQFRDIDNLDPTPDPEITMDDDSYSIGRQTATITITDFNANMDVQSPEFTTSVVQFFSSDTSVILSSNTLILEETDDSSGVYTGKFIVENNFAILYQQEPTIELSYTEDFAVVRDVARAKVTVNTNTAGAITISDFYMDEENTSKVDFQPYTQGIKVKLVDGATLTDDDIVVEMAFGHADLEGSLPIHIQMYYLPAGLDDTSAENWKIVRLSGDQNDKLVDFQARTITSDPAPCNPPSGRCAEEPLGEGVYILGRDTGLGGGGGGGLVRPGLVVNVLAGAGIFTGGSGGSAAPSFGDASIISLGDGSEGFGGVISNTRISSLETTQEVKTGDQVTLRFNLYENQGITNLERFKMFLNFEGENYDTSNIDTYISYERGGEITLVDPHEKFETVNIEILQEDAWNLIVKVDVIFANTMNTSILVESWDLDRNVGKKIFPDVLHVEPSILLADAKNDFEPILEPSNIVEPELKEIPTWIKSNALWWQQKQIDDSDFVAGIEYLIHKSMIKIEGNEPTKNISGGEIPSWIRDLAGLWSNDSITDDEFVQAMQWLINNGDLQVDI